MARIERFEEIEAWQKGRDLRRAIYNCSRNGAFCKDFALRDQIRRSAISITSNIAEGFERGGNKEFIQFLANSKGSCGELRDRPLAVLRCSKVDPFRGVVPVAEKRLSTPTGKTSPSTFQPAEPSRRRL